ncbi:hypothetical protein BD410DRAFT_866184 [Rickenella mellea]|uniref:Dystroglycan C-terminal domain-containing protein n=1 Tax=Rickenella mellea TaxID=50990 RepID=A0A4Y7Q3W2_9AGAM|nr:hypothetical protein BD410DRAFT_866184 [Rickenella mellea]
MTAWVDRITSDGGGIAQQSLAQNMTLNSSSTALTWDPVAASPGRYFINAWAASNSSRVKNALATMMFDIQAGPDLSCLHVIPVITQTTQTSPSPTSTSTSTPAASASSTNNRLTIVAITSIVVAVCLLMAGIIGICMVRRSRRKDKRKFRPYAFSAGDGSYMAKAEGKANAPEIPEKGALERDVESAQTSTDVPNLPSRFSL